MKTSVSPTSVRMVARWARTTPHRTPRNVPLVNAGVVVKTIINDRPTQRHAPVRLQPPTRHVGHVLQCMDKHVCLVSPVNNVVNAVGRVQVKAVQTRSRVMATPTLTPTRTPIRIPKRVIPMHDHDPPMRGQVVRQDSDAMDVVHVQPVGIAAHQVPGTHIAVQPVHAEAHVRLIRWKKNAYAKWPKANV